MDFGHNNVQRISKAFTLNPNNNIDDPCISLWNKTTLTLLKSKKSEYYNVICTVIDKMGEASAKAQVLPTAITTSSKIQFNDNNLYLYSVDNKAIGILKVGRKKLFYRSMTGDFKEIEPLCVLDFYVSETVQRKGIGKILFEAMLAFEKTSPERLAYDRPSPKLIGFLRRHYGLSDYIPQSNNFVVFKQYFVSGAPSLVQNPTVASSNEINSRPPMKRPDSDQTAITPIMLNTIDSRTFQQEQTQEYVYQQEYTPQTGNNPQNNYSNQQNNYPQQNYPQTNYGQTQNNYPPQTNNRSPTQGSANQAVQYRTSNNQSPVQYRSPSSQNVYAQSPQSNYSTPPPLNRSPSSIGNYQTQRSPSTQNVSSPNSHTFYTTTAQSFYSQNNLVSPSPSKRFVQYNPITHECAEVERNGDPRKTGKKMSSSKLQGY